MLTRLPATLLLLLFHTQSTSAFSLHIPREDQVSADYTDDSLFQETILNVTNTYRKQHNATALRWNDTLAEYAEEWSEKCEFEHSVRVP